MTWRTKVKLQGEDILLARKGLTRSYSYTFACVRFSFAFRRCRWDHWGATWRGPHFVVSKAYCRLQSGSHRSNCGYVDGRQHTDDCILGDIAPVTQLYRCCVLWRYKFSENFCYLNSKVSRKRLVRFVYELHRNDQPLIPYYCRLVAILDSVFKVQYCVICLPRREWYNQFDSPHM
jgi:hypothetical protein